MISLGKIKVLHIAQSNGGVAEYLKMLFKYIDKNFYEFDLLCSKQYKAEEKNFRKSGYKISMIDMERKISPMKDFKSVLEIIRYIKNSKPDIIHLHSSKAGALGRIAIVLGVITFQFNHIPVLYNPHGWAFDMGTSKFKKRFYVLVEKIGSLFTDKVIVISNYEKKAAVKNKICKEKKLKVILNGIDFSRYLAIYNREEQLAEMHIKNDSLIIGMVGRLTEQKSPQTFIRIAKEIKKKHVNAYFILVGDGELKADVVKQIEEYNLQDSTLITGWIDEVPKFISLFDIAILTSKWEGFGLVLAEYMAMGKPVVASRVGGILDIIIDNYNGLLASPDSVDEFVANIIKLTDNPEICGELANNGHKFVEEKLNILRVVDEHEQIYNNYSTNRIIAVSLEVVNK